MGLRAEALPEEPVRKSSTERGPQISVLAKIKARNLYLNQGLAVPSVAKECGLSESTVRNWVKVGKWAVERKTVYSRLLSKQDAQREETGNAVIQAIASEAEEHALSAMANVKQALVREDKDAAKDFQAYTAGVKNLASTARMLREPLSSGSGEGSTVNLNLFFSPPKLEREAKQVQEASINV